MGQLPLGLLWRITVFWVDSKGGGGEILKWQVRDFRRR